jgi:hypothetical protein
MALPARIALALLLCAAPVAAQQLTDQNPAPSATMASTVPDSTELPVSTARSASIQPVKPDKPQPRGNFFTRPFYDKNIRLLAEMNMGAAVLDDVTSRMVIERGGYERNPLMRPFVHNSGTVAAESVAEVWLMAFVADRLKRSEHSLWRKVWWLPQTVNITAKVSGGIYNSVLLTQ